MLQDDSIVDRIVSRLLFVCYAMACESRKKQMMLTSMFKKISDEEREVVIAKELELLNASAAIERSLKRETIEKHLVGRPRKSALVLQPDQSKENIEDAKKDTSQPKQRKRHSYNQWFTKELFPPIQDAVKRYGQNTAAVNYLKLAFKTPGGPSPYEQLSRSNLWDWFDTRGNLKPNYMEAAKLGHLPKRQNQNLPILENYPEVRD